MKAALRASLSSVMLAGIQCFGLAQKGVRVLCYHRVHDEKKHYLAVPTARFKEQMQYLKDSGFKTISLRDLLDGKEDEKTVVITFDDGYADNYENAYPVMQKLGFGGAIFCIVNQLGQKEFLNKQQIQIMEKSGFEFGAHTLNHVNLKKAENSVKKNEIEMSKKKLEEFLGHRVDFFCYPYGIYDEESLGFVKAAGYRGACSNRPGVNQKPDPYLIRRTEISGFDTLDDFKKKCAGAFDLLHQGLHWIRGRP